MSLSKWLPCDFEQCHPLLWGGGILVDHWSTISSCIWCKAITYTSAELWSIEPQGTNFSGICIKIQFVFFQKKIFSNCCFQNICHFIQASLHVLMDCIGNNIKNLCRELVCITVKWTWYNGRDIFFHITSGRNITSGRIDTCKGVNQLKELFFLNLIII